jgi:cyanophycinase
MGYILLEGGAEFAGRMAEPDQQAIERAGGSNARIRIIPTAAAPDHNDQRAGANGVRWFRGLGAHDTLVVPLTDRTAANDPTIVATLRSAQLIYLLGGFTDYLGQTLAGSASWQAIVDAHAAGAVIAGSSAGAMVLCQHFFNPAASQVVPGLGLLANSCVIPHHDTFGRRWATQLRASLPQALLFGIDERTGMLDDGSAKRWQVYGQGQITLYVGKETRVYARGEEFELPQLV